MIREGKEYAQWHPNVIIKVPSTTEGLKAVYRLAQEGIRTNVTLCFNANQALFAARAGAFIISPFIGRVDDTGVDGMTHPRDCRDLPQRPGDQDPGAVGIHPPPAPYHRQRAGRRRHRHLPVQGARAEYEAPAHRQRDREVLGRLAQPPVDRYTGAFDAIFTLDAAASRRKRCHTIPT